MLYRVFYCVVLYEVADISLCCTGDTLLIRVLYCFSDGQTVRGG